MATTDPTANKRIFRLATKAFRSGFSYLAVESVKTTRAEAGEPAFSIKTAHLKRHHPDFTLFIGSDPDAQDASPVACAYLPGMFRSSKIGLGNVKNAPETVQWETMKSKSFGSRDYEWAMPLGSGKHQDLQWKRSKKHAIDGKEPGKGQSWILVEPGDSDTIYAIFRMQGGIDHCATVQINMNQGSEFDYMILITGMLLYSFSTM
ncbi:unnamed protein product [Clonostachys byssicola]|uniref:Uncharacterized protein n=1 Tax=Clonostachys byssicola TaxID=160290 RepID=A0A9N9UBJ3_9HYPO|nr:unnamed protein product [Clonostachys byssicola]